ncbi:hypothetical protein [Streptomyces sp. DG1A-41]|uniref:hypothetical protein n=1 Tax=Streptomyces sp. DG1A-41 TaxID=3125779 RepID=UPI0030D6130B
MATSLNSGPDTPAQDGSGPRTPVGVWTGTAVHDDQTETFTISFAPDGGLTLVTPISTGRGTWEPTESGFTYAFTETLAPEAGRPGHVDVVVRARCSGGTYAGSGPAEVRTPDGTVVHRTTFDTSAELRTEVWRDLLADGSSPLGSAPQAVREAAALAGAQAEKADSERRVQPEVIQALTDAGFPRWFVPRSQGGEPGTFADLTRSVAALGEECSATAWLASLFAFAPRYVACLPERAQSEVWAAGPDARVVVVNKPLGTAEPTEGGWRLTGEWTFVSGVEYADWALLAGPAMPGPAGSGGGAAGGPGAGGAGAVAGGPGSGGPGGGGPGGPGGKGGPRFFLVPRADFSYRDTWHSLGMRGTGSHTLVLDDSFVPEYRTCVRADAMQGRTVGVPGPPLPTLAVNGLTFVAPALGAAYGALNAAVGLSVPPGGPRAEAAQAYQVGYARAAGLVDAARLLVERVADTADGAALTPALVRRSRRDAALALELLTDAADLLLRTGGTRAQEDHHPLQRFWRDIRSVASHAVMQFEPAALGYTRGITA